MSNENGRSKKSAGGKVGATGLAIIFIIGIVIAWASYKRIPTGYVGVVYNVSGGVTGKVYSEGGYFIKPTERISKYSVGIEQSYLTASNDGDSEDDDSFEVPSSDGKGLTIDLTFTYRFDQDRVSDTFKRFRGLSGKEVKNTFIKPNVMTWTKEVTSRYPVTELIGSQRSQINIELTEYLKDKFNDYGIIIESASILDINPDKETRAAIQKKVTAQQEKELAEVEAETAKINAKKEQQVAEIEAQSAKIKAQGKADAKKIAADAEAEANKKIAASLTPELVEKIKYEQWNGKLPTVQGGSTPIIDMRGASTEE